MSADAVLSATDAWKEAVALLSAAGIDSARTDARILLNAVLEEQSLLPPPPSRILTAEEHALFTRLVGRRSAHEPLAYITGNREFWSLEFAVGTGVLIPRPETETLVEEAVREFRNCGHALRALDLGTGTACILTAFLSEFPEASGIGLDASAQSVAWARMNLARHALEKRARIDHMDWSRARELGRFDIVFCNPPYISADEMKDLQDDVRRFEPREALEAGPDGLSAYRALSALIRDVLAPGGAAFLELGFGQKGAVSRLFEAGGLVVARSVRDLAGIERCLVLKPEAG